MAQTGVGAKPVFAPTLFLAKNVVARELAPPFSQKVTLRRRKLGIALCNFCKIA